MRLRRLWRNLRHGARVDFELDQELRALLEMLVDEKVAAGSDPIEARRLATIELGGIEPVKERVREIRMGIRVETLLQDVRYALRGLRRTPGFASAAILTLAFAIGANTAMFTLLNTLVLKRLAIPDPDGLLAIAPLNSRGLPRTTPMSAVEKLRDGPLDHMCAYLGGVIFPVLANRSPVQTSTTFITAECLAAFGVTPVIGRGITDADAPVRGPGAHVALISHRLWTSAYNADPAAVGQIILVNNVPLTIIGILPRGFAGLEIDSGIDIFTPFEAVLPAARGRSQLASYLLGRLRPGVTREAAAAEIEARWPTLLEAVLPAGMEATERAQLLDSKPRLISLGRGASRLRDRYTRPVMLVFGLTALLLLLACVNLGSLLLARARARSSELRLRLALGGSRMRIAQQMLVESLMLSLLGAAVAVPMAYLTAVGLASLMPPTSVSYALSFVPDVRVFAATTLSAIGVGTLMGALPIWFASRQALARGVDSGRIIAVSTVWSRTLLVAQIALAAVMLIDATLLARSLYLLQTRDLGMRTEDILTVKLAPLPNASYDRSGRESYYPGLLEQVRRLPSVRNAAFVLNSPRLTTTGPGSPVAWRGDEYGDVTTALDLVSPGYFATVGMRLLAGRDVAWQDANDTEKVAIVSDSLARVLAPDGRVVGRAIHIRTLPNDLEYVIVGVVSDATMGDPREVHPRVVYRPLLQRGAAAALNPNLVIETTDVTSAASGVRQILQAGGRDYAQEVISLDDLLARAPATERMGASVAIAVAAIALLLAVIGVHGLLAYVVAQRTREIGVRIALGAVPAMAAFAVLREALVICAIGVAVGIPLAALSARSLRSLMFGISEADAATFAATALAFMITGALAGAIPARRAAAIDPAVALRAE